MSVMEADIFLRAQQLDEANRKVRAANDELAALCRFQNEQLSQNRTLMALVVDSSSDAIVGKDPERIITSWNKGAERVYGYSAQEMLGRCITVLVPEAKQQELNRIIEEVRGRECH